MEKLEEAQKLRITSKFSISITDKVLDEFANIIFIENKMKLCEKACHNKYYELYEKNKNNQYFNFGELSDNISSCSYDCEEDYRRITDHQKKGSEISYVY